jgi:hypothetical protein
MCVGMAACCRWLATGSSRTWFGRARPCSPLRATQVESRRRRCRAQKNLPRLPIPAMSPNRSASASPEPSTSSSDASSVSSSDGDSAVGDMEAAVASAMAAEATVRGAGGGAGGGGVAALERVRVTVLRRGEGPECADCEGCRSGSGGGAAGCADARGAAGLAAVEVDAMELLRYARRGWEGEGPGLWLSQHRPRHSRPLKRQRAGVSRCVARCRVNTFVDVNACVRAAAGTTTCLWARTGTWATAAPRAQARRWPWPYASCTGARERSAWPQCPCHDTVRLAPLPLLLTLSSSAAPARPC